MSEDLSAAPEKPRRPRIPPWTKEGSEPVAVPAPAGVGPRARWQLKDLDNVPGDGDWHALAEYGATTGYQVARICNAMGLLPAGVYEFGVSPVSDGSSNTQLVVRRKGASIGAVEFEAELLVAEEVAELLAGEEAAPEAPAPLDRVAEDGYPGSGY